MRTSEGGLPKKNITKQFHTYQKPTHHNEGVFLLQKGRLICLFMEVRLIKPVRILSPELSLLAEIDNYESMFFTRRFHGIGELELRINRYKKHTDLLQKGNLLMIGSSVNKVFIVKHREIELNEDGKVSENWTVKALALKSIVGQRITLPPIHTGYDNKQGTVETVMKHYVLNNIVHPEDSKRAIPQVVVSEDLLRGSIISWQSRFKNLAEEVMNISNVSEIGWDIHIDVKQKKWVFDVIEGKNLTVNQSEYPPVIFSPQFESLQSLHYAESDLNFKNAAYVGGQGEGIERRIIQIGSDTDTGLNRHEIFVDARDISEQGEGDPPISKSEEEVVYELTSRGEQQLKEFLQENYLDGQILTNGPFKYEEDYDLGDIVTIQNKDWNVTMDIRLTEVKEIYESGGFRIEGVFGKSMPTLIDKVKREIGQVSAEVRK